jgi:undecaprenyl-diphosphatase
MIFPFDNSIEVAIASLRTPGLTNFFSAITHLADVLVVFVVLVLALAAFVMSKRFTFAWALLIAVAGSTITTAILKVVVERARPSDVVALVTEDSYSFPSGHATAVVALYGFLLYACYKMFPQWWARALSVLAGAVIILLVGFSRVYLGVHYPTDVLAGYLVGALWVYIAISLLSRYRPVSRRR